jgi:hypothetical protein
MDISAFKNTKPKFANAKLPSKTAKYDFKTDLNRAKEIEVKICNSLSGTLLESDTIQEGGDFHIDGFQFELKADFRAEDTGNLFIEHYSNIESKRLGGPYACIQKEVYVILYVLPKQNRVLAFEPETLVDFVELHQSQFRLINIKNKNHTTAGYAIPIKDLEELAFLDLDASSPHFKQKFYEACEHQFPYVEAV